MFFVAEFFVFNKLQENETSAFLHHQDMKNRLKDLTIFQHFNVPQDSLIFTKAKDTSKSGYCCPKCGKIYTWSYTMKRHLRFECGKEPQFQCRHCLNKFKRKCHLMSHVRNRHNGII